ncbi:MAG: transglutaminase-like domain-containing protein [Candidatus Electrothrix aestuarii]|uniref:Transglutaminase-like domain-containing protein n=1 Tax=Candidatus Electrothrix aestuarii TaxID=3062594 RepID=A0AAU8M0W2_9BACT|nr:transglutaminase-like domain-containing protein [Candidatus Electrothrix aestuarii]
MPLPPFFSGAILLFWGWQTGLLPFALPLAGLIEGSRYVTTKWDLSQSDFNRLTDICTILLAGLAIFFLTTDSLRASLKILRWLPVVCFPLFAAQKYSVAGRIDIRALMLLARNKAVAADNQPRTIDVSSPYAAICLLAAGTGNARDGSFFIGLLLFTAWALWPQRSKRYSPLLWFLLLALIGSAGYAGHIGLYHLQRKAMMMFSNWWVTGNNDPFKRSTSMGDIGELKLSDRIVFRVTPETKPFQPILLREASYNLYKEAIWHAAPAHFSDLKPEKDQSTWKLQPDHGVKAKKFFTVWTPLEEDKIILKLPLGSYQLGNLPVSRLKKTPLGAVKAEEGPRLLGYQVHYQEGISDDLAPTDNDLYIPEEELPAIQKIIKELHLTAKTPEQVIQVLEDFFQTQFNYSLKLRAAAQGKTPLATFLLSSRAGHCEYFATATVLLLRACGIPARYATGWSAHERSAWGKQIIVRSRHAHAWTLVYQNGTWNNLDTTSSSWIEEENAAASPFHFFQDLWSSLLFTFSRWWWGSEEGILEKWWWVLLIPLVIILAKRLRAGRKIRRIQTDSRKKSEQDIRKDSTYYKIEQHLNALGFERNFWEPPLSWVRRIKRITPPHMLSENILSFLTLYYRERFDKDGLTEAQQLQMKKNADIVLKELKEKEKSS